MTAPSATSRVDWRRISRGLYWIGGGTFLLLTTLDVLDWSFWIEALPYWPILLVAAGLRLMFERSRAPWAVLLSPLLVFSTLSYLAWEGHRQAPGDWALLRAERPEGVDQWTLEGRMALADLAVTSRPLPSGVLVDGRAKTRRLRGAVVEEIRGEARVRLGRSGAFHPKPPFRQEWELAVSESLPMKMRLRLALTDAAIDLATARLTRIELDGAFNDMTLRLGAPDSEVRVSAEGAFNDLELVVPDDVPVRVSTGGFLNIMRGRPSRSRKGPGYRVWMQGAFNRVTIRSPRDGLGHARSAARGRPGAGPALRGRDIAPVPRKMHILQAASGHFRAHRKPAPVGPAP